MAIGAVVGVAVLIVSTSVPAAAFYQILPAATPIKPVQQTNNPS